MESRRRSNYELAEQVAACGAGARRVPVGTLWVVNDNPEPTGRGFHLSTFNFHGSCAL